MRLHRAAAATIAAACFVWAAIAAGEGTWRELFVSEKAAELATHVLTIRHEDLTNSTAGFTQTVTVASVKTSVVMLASVKLVTPFQDTNAPALNTNLWLRLGDGTDTSYFLGSTSMALSNSPVYVSVNAASNKYYTTDTIDAILVPTTNYALSALDEGEVRIYLKVFAKP